MALMFRESSYLTSDLAGTQRLCSADTDEEEETTLVLQTGNVASLPGCMRRRRVFAAGMVLVTCAIAAVTAHLTSQRQKGHAAPILVSSTADRREIAAYPMQSGQDPALYGDAYSMSDKPANSRNMQDNSWMVDVARSSPSTEVDMLAQGKQDQDSAHLAAAEAAAHYADVMPIVPSGKQPLQNASVQQGGVKPLENRHDGNICAHDEEYFGKLCYKHCRLLTNGAYPIRTTPWSCCKAHPCTIFNQRHEKGMCSGFDVAGDGAEGGGRSSCPHRPGVCLTNEELHLGRCFKQCSALTNGVYPNRVTAVTCCKRRGAWCLFPGNLKTSTSFMVGGGAGDGDVSTPGKNHPPLPVLAEGPQ